MVEKPVNLKCGLRVECVVNRHDNTGYGCVVWSVYVRRDWWCTRYSCTAVREGATDGRQKFGDKRMLFCLFFKIVLAYEGTTRLLL